MITASDLVCLPYTSDLSEAGIRYACRALPHTYDRVGGSPFERLRRVVAEVAVELAFRRDLARQNILFDVRGAIPFTDPDQYDVSLGGHRCDIQSYLISYREQIRSLHADPGQLLQAPGLVPLDQYVGDARSATDLYVFAFLTGLVASSPLDIKRVNAVGGPAYFMHVMPPAWVRPPSWIPLGSLALKSESELPLSVEIGGQNGSQEFITQTIELEPCSRVQIDTDLYSLAYVHSSLRPTARLGIHSSSRHEMHLIQPSEWGNIWVYGMRIYLAGWIARDEFRQRASLLPEGSRVFQYDRTMTRNLALPVAELRAIPELLSRTQTWAGTRTNEPGGPVV